MSWNVYLLRAAGFESVREIPEGWSPPPLGPSDAVASRLRAALPSLHFSRPGLASLRGEDFSLELFLPHSPSIPGLQLVATGDADALFDALGKLCAALDVRALAADLGDFIRFDQDPLTGRHTCRNPPRPEHWAPA